MSRSEKIQSCLTWALMLAWSIFSGGRVAADMPTARPDSFIQGEKFMREIKAEGFRVQLDLSTQVLRLEIPEDRSFERPGDQSRGEQEAPIAPTVSEIRSQGFVSASMLAQKAKQFDDGLYAAVELAAEQGSGRFKGKSFLLRNVAGALEALKQTPAGNPQEVIFAACKVAGMKINIPHQLQKAVQDTTEEFLKDSLRSKPIGFYTWSEELGAIFRQDRMLQTELKGKEGIEALVKILQADRSARGTYEAYLSLVAKLTNPLAYPDLRGQIIALEQGQPEGASKGIYFFPPSRSHETDLIKQLYGNRPIPEGFSLVDEMIKRIKEGSLQLRPTAESGWYDYQTWVLEPLVIPEKMPEASQLDFAESYRKQLLELFKGMLALTRETHIKQLEIPLAGAAAPLRPSKPVIHIYPELGTEPLATMYLRRSQSYRFIRTVMEKMFGSEALAKMHRLAVTGLVKENLDEELRLMEALFYGAHVAVCQEIGMTFSTSLPLGSGKGAGADVAEFQAWRASFKNDPDVGRDVRMMVPVFYDILRKKTKAWVFLGWSSRPVTVSYAKAPKAKVFDQVGNEVRVDRVDLLFHPTRHELAYPVTAEVYVGRILNRDEFRQLCDRYKTRSAILANLE
jgi:hypothetical protein